MELQEKLKELRGRQIADLSLYDKQLIEEAYTQYCLKEVRTCNCPDRYDEAIIETLIMIEKGVKPMNERRFMLKNGVLLRAGGFGSAEIYINTTLTDEVAIKHLQMCPDDIDLFAVFPDDWQSIVNTSGKKDEVFKPAEPEQQHGGEQNERKNSEKTTSTL